MNKIEIRIEEFDEEDNSYLAIDAMLTVLDHEKKFFESIDLQISKISLLK